MAQVCGCALVLLLATTASCIEVSRDRHVVSLQTNGESETDFVLQAAERIENNFLNNNNNDNNNNNNNSLSLNLDLEWMPGEACPPTLTCMECCLVTFNQNYALWHDCCSCRLCLQSKWCNPIRTVDDLERADSQLDTLSFDFMSCSTAPVCRGEQFFDTSNLRCVACVHTEAKCLSAGATMISKCKLDANGKSPTKDISLCKCTTPPAERTFAIATTPDFSLPSASQNQPCQQRANIFMAPIELLTVRGFTTQHITRCKEGCGDDDPDCAGYVTLDKNFVGRGAFSIFQQITDRDIDQGAACGVPFLTDSGKISGYQPLDIHLSSASTTKLPPQFSAKSIQLHPSNNVIDEWENLVLQGLVKFCCPAKVTSFWGAVVTATRAIGHVFSSEEWGSRWQCTQANYDNPSDHCCRFLEVTGISRIPMSKKEFYYFYPGVDVNARDTEPLDAKHQRHYIYLTQFRCPSRR